MGEINNIDRAIHHGSTGCMGGNQDSARRKKASRVVIALVVAPCSPLWCSTSLNQEGQHE
jgi:hypothetical protein